MQQPNPIIKDLVLVGGGHSHAIALKLFGMYPLPGLRLTLIADTSHTPYSGMLPGHVAGFYSYDETHIDLRCLARFSGAQFYLDRAVELDLDNNKVICANHPPVAFDYLSFDIGSTPARLSVPGAAEYAIPAKPVPKFLESWNQLLQSVEEIPGKPLSIGIVGGGAGGVELALNMQHHLRQIRQGEKSSPSPIHLFHRGTRLVSGYNPSVSRRLQKIFQEREIELHLQESVSEVTPRKVSCESGLTVECDRIFWVTQASAPSWIKASGLATDSEGFILVDDRLQSVSHPHVFAAGDIATMKNYSRPKAGVFAVRQGKPLFENLQRIVLGKSLKNYAPQKWYLSLIGTGDKSAIASWGFLSWQSSLLWHWKDAIDRKFMRRFSELPEMEQGDGETRRRGDKGTEKISSNLQPVGCLFQRSYANASCSTWGDTGLSRCGFGRSTAGNGTFHSGVPPEYVPHEFPLTTSEFRTQPLPKTALDSPSTFNPMPCAGCGSKVGSTVLNRVLQRLPVSESSEVLIGLKSPDDAAVVQVPEGLLMVHTIDYFRSLINDPFIFGQIATNHCLSDIYAMGATPQTALAVVTVPYGTQAKLEESLYQLLAGAAKVLQQSQTSLVGGHTTEGAELALGLSCNGTVQRDRLLLKSGIKPGQVLILTKPLGTGTLFAADMRYRAKGRWIDGAVQSMLISNQAAAKIVAEHGASACTDITGFGLLGHLGEMIQASSVAVRLELKAVPILEGAIETIEMGITSSLQPQNLKASCYVSTPPAPNSVYSLLFDPQTAGGLLAAIPLEGASACIEALKSSGYPNSRIIGQVTGLSESPAIAIQQ